MQVLMSLTRGIIVGIRPIPINLLPSTVTYKKYTGKDRFNKPSYEANVEIERVRIDEEEAKIIQGLSESDRYSHVLYYDCVNSIPNTINFEVDSVILDGGKKFLIKKVKPYRTFNGRLHHYELELIT